VIIVCGASCAARELLEEEWKKRTTSKLPQTADPLASGRKLG
jgi:hypothetical protein